jgi:uncharacterized protein YaaW (UPF0174 family)
MTIKFREDPDLMFLQFCDNEDLNVLVQILVGDLNEGLSKEFRFKSCNENYKLIWDLISGELQLFGGDSMANKFRGHGVLYKDIVGDACIKLGEKVGDYDDVDELEIKLILALLQIILKKMNQKDREELCRIADLRPKSFDTPTVYSEYNKVLRQGGAKAIKAILIIANPVANKITGVNFGGIGLGVAGGAFFVPALIPVINIVYTSILSGYGLARISGPAYRVTIPSCVAISYMRRKHLCSDFL